jgi:small subunit ribosomal protein S4
MGDPKKLRKKYDTPRHPWVKGNIEAGKILKKEFGLRNAQEILRAQSFLKKYKNIAKRLIAQKTAQGEKEKTQILEKLQNLGLLPTGSDLDSILNLKVETILGRRIQSVLFNKKLARSVKQARQFIVHRHVSIGDKEITAPAYLISLEEESRLTFKSKSALADEEHPERAIAAEVKEIKEEAAAIKPKKEEKKTEKVAEAAKKVEASAEVKETVEPEVKEEVKQPETPKEAEEAPVEDKKEETKPEGEQK